MDFLPTKGVEYLLAIGYLLLLVPCWWLFAGRAGEPELAPAAASAGGRGPGWFRVPSGYHFHRGHTWARPDEGGLLRVGMDDFARLFLGRPRALLLPAVGERLEQGEKGWSVQVGGHEVPLLSPAQGEVAEINEEAVANPDLVQHDPYGRGWLLKIRTSRPAAGLRNLLPASLARPWMDETSRRLGTMMGADLGVVLQDGGVLVSGIARELGGEDWPRLAAEMFLTAPEEA
jgi:glycine cleavage system H lipoate-binding protein